MNPTGVFLPNLTPTGVILIYYVLQFLVTDNFGKHMLYRIAYTVYDFMPANETIFYDEISDYLDVVIDIFF